MSGASQKAVYLLGMPPGVLPQIPSEPAVAPRRFERVADFFQAPDLAPGVVALGPELPPAEVLRALRLLGESEEEWTPILVLDSDPDSLLGLPVSPAAPAPLADLVARYLDVEETRPVMSLPTFTRIVAKARHDINNPLTVAMAEMQLLLLDVEDAEVRSGLEAVEQQLRKIRDLVAGLPGVRRK